MIRGEKYCRLKNPGFTGVLFFLYTKNHAIVAGLKRGLPMSLEKKTPIV